MTSDVPLNYVGIKKSQNFV